ncbi:sigma-70 family RNA polymerase sigma factor [Stigmatella sp. ncwal1]|uniref:Sigma-70 family RNA polymerase sigma factor n=1 Tax=Stigmatella ashevillensis TaxID=2995309 RepID=A0ABT5DM53_9BACT|nr:sigma-70 family RNA polymerase sigma factor [Stigmatella ashevillena]MDC0714679.1 sigma-70 family RNA polymerase sigma factor [Stigmatella ashevillena]
MNPTDPKSPPPLSIPEIRRGNLDAAKRKEDPRIQAVLQGHREAAESLLEEMLPRVRNLVRYLVKGDSEAEDLAQEALLAVLRGLPSYRGEGTFRSWTDRVVARTVFSGLKRERNENPRRSEEAVELVAVPSADAPLDEYVHRRHMVTLLDRIPAEQRHALVLHHVMELSVPEIASELGVPFETVRSRLRLGRTALRTLAEKKAVKEAEEKES